MRRALLGLIVVMFLGVAVGAASTVTVTFIASPDHNATVLVNGSPVPVLTSYRVDIYSGTTVTTTKDCAKPTPATVGGVANVVTCTGVSVPSNVSLTAKVVAIGPGGESTSVASDPFASVAAPAAPGKPTVQ